MDAYILSSSSTWLIVSLPLISHNNHWQRVKALNALPLRDVRLRLCLCHDRNQIFCRIAQYEASEIYEHRTR